MAGLCATGAATVVNAQTDITVDRFGQRSRSQPTIIMLYGSDGLTSSGRYELAAQTIASAGYSVLLPRYFEATGDRRARYGDIRTKFSAWSQAIESVLESQPPGRIGLVGFSLGGALALGLAARSPKIRAVVNFFGFEPAGLDEGRKLPPTLILHGDSDRVVPVSNASSIERLIRSQGGVVESRIYAGEGHGLSLASLPDAVSRAKLFLQRHV